MKDILLKQIDDNAFCFINEDKEIIEKNDNSCLIKRIENNKIKFYQYTELENKKVQVSIYDSIKDNQEIRRAAEFICNFNDKDILEEINKKTYKLDGNLLENLQIFI